eukprot:SAG31_NODE_2635_length_5340_cov_15.869681_7_plen_396_part_00
MLWSSKPSRTTSQMPCELTLSNTSLAPNSPAEQRSCLTIRTTLTVAAHNLIRLDKLDEDLRAAAAEFMAQDRKALARAIEKRTLSTENLELANRDGDLGRAKHIEKGLGIVDRVIAELQSKLDGGLEAYGWMPSEKSIAAAREKVRLRKERKAQDAHRIAMAEKRKIPKKKRKLVVAPSNAADAGSVAPSPIDKTIVFGADEPADARLDKLFSKAMELEHPGIDEEGIATMKSKIADGQFKIEHYMDMWTRRLETDMDVVVQVEHAVIDGEPKSETTAAAPANEAKATPTVDSSDGTRGPEETTFTQSSVMVVYDKDEPPASKLDKLFAMAMDLQHPGIDQEGIDTMKGEHLAANLAKLETKMWKVQEAGRGEGGAGSVLSRGDFSRHGGTADCR